MVPLQGGLLGGVLKKEREGRAVSLKLDDKVLERPDGIFPGYRLAPEHYAW